MLLTWHNLRYYQRLMQGIRDAIEQGALEPYAAQFHAERAKGDIAPL